MTTPHAVPTGYTYTLARRFDEHAALFSAWEDLYARAAHRAVTTAPGWFYGLWFYHAGTGTVRTLAVWQGDELVLLLPFREAAGGRWPRLEALCDIVPVLSAADDDGPFRFCLEVLEGLYGRADLLLERADPASPPVAALLRAAAERGGAVRALRTEDNVVVDLAGGWDAYLAGLSPNTREGVRKAQGRLRREVGSFRVECAATPDEVRCAVDRVLVVDAQSWKFGRGGAMCRSAGEDVQFKCGFERLAETGHVRVFLLEVDGAPAAFIAGTVQDNTAWFWIWSHAEAWRRFVPGKVLMFHALRALAEEGVRRVDFWGRHDRFKASWSTCTIPRATLVLEAPRSSAERAGRALAATAARAAAPLRAFFLGAPERFRLREDRPAPAERLVAPLAARLREVRGRRGCVRVVVGEAERRPCPRVTVRAATDRDRCALGRANAGASPYVFDVEGAVRGGIAIAPVEWGRALRVDDLWFVGDDAALHARCLRTFLHGHPGVVRLYEPRTRTLERGGASAAAVLAGG
jgi:CelD/BcsL family acetyltransferase involved in cellulose biosynthesis